MGLSPERFERLAQYGNSYKGKKIIKIGSVVVQELRYFFFIKLVVPRYHRICMDASVWAHCAYYTISEIIISSSFGTQ